MTIDKITEVLQEKQFYHGRMLSGSKTSPKGERCVWNANIVTRNNGKVWYGDLNLTTEFARLNDAAKAIGEPLYILREHDARFDREKDSVESLISKAVWTTNTPIPV